MFRIAVEDDYSQVVIIKKEIHQKHCTNEPDFYKDIEDVLPLTGFKDELSKGNVYVLENENMIIGYVFVYIIDVKDHPVVFDQKILFIDDFAILDSWKRKGYGKKMFLGIEEVAKKIGANTIELHVWDFNDEAKRFYDNLGMRKTRIRMKKVVY